MAISNGYATLAELKEWLAIPANDALDDRLLERAVEAASRSIDQYCNRRFYLDASASARTFAATMARLLRTPDIGSLTGLVVKTDDNADGTFETTRAASSYQTEPSYIALEPITAIRLFSTSWPLSSDGREQVQVTAKWGWPVVPTEVEQACLILASRWFKRKNSPEGVLSFAEAGVIRISATDRDAIALISPYVVIGFA